MSAARPGIVPILASVSQPVGPFVFRLYRHSCGTVAFAILSDMQVVQGRPPEFTGFVTAGTPGELRLLADAMEGLLA